MTGPTPEASAESAATLVERALDIHHAGRPDEAAVHYCRILERWPAQAQAVHFLGIARHQQGRSEEGVDLLRRSLAMRPDLADWHNDLGNVLAAIGCHGEAAAAFIAALDLNPRAAVVWNNLGAVLQREGQHDEAVLAFENAVALDPRCADALTNLGNSLAFLGRADEAARSYCAAYVLHPDPAKPRQMLGLAYYTLGRIDEAARVYRAWLEEEPGHPIARHLLAACTGENVPARAANAYVETYFDECAESFDQKLVECLSYRIPQHVDEVLRELAIPADSLDILDAGCGTGLCGPYLAPRARRLVGVDLSEKSLAVAAGKGFYGSLVKAELTEYLAANAASFDLVVLADALIYFGRLEEVLQAAARALRHRGLIIASVEEAGPSDEGFAIYPSGRYGHSRAYLAAAFWGAGFDLVSVTSVDVRSELGEPVRGLLVVARKR